MNKFNKVDTPDEVNTPDTIVIYCFFGDYNSGKSYIAKSLYEKYKEDSYLTSFAESVKVEFLQLYNLTTGNNLTYRDLIDNREIKEKLRDQIIRYAEDVKLTRGSDYWFRTLIRRVINEIESRPNINKIFIDDLRFEVEFVNLINFIQEAEEEFGFHMFDLHLIEVRSELSKKDPQLAINEDLIENIENIINKKLTYVIYNNQRSSCQTSTSVEFDLSSF